MKLSGNKMSSLFKSNISSGVKKESKRPTGEGKTASSSTSTGDKLSSVISKNNKTSVRAFDIEDNISKIDKAKTGAENAINALTSIKLDLIDAGPGLTKEVSTIQDLFFEGHRKLQNFEKKFKAVVKKAGGEIQQEPDEIEPEIEPESEPETEATTDSDKSFYTDIKV